MATPPIPRRSALSPRPAGGRLLPRQAGGILLAVGVGASFWAGLHLQATVTLPPAALPTRLAQSASDSQNSRLPPNRQTVADSLLGGRSNRNANELLSSGPDVAATYQAVYDLIKEHYVDKLPRDQALAWGSVRAMLATLNDPNCYFLEPTQRTLLDDEARGHFTGTGAIVAVRARITDGYTEHKIVVVSALTASPAQKAGLHPGDIITHIDGRWILGADPYLKVNKLLQKVQAGTADGGGDSTDDPAIRRETDAARKRAEGGLGLFAARMALRGDPVTITNYKLPDGPLRLTVERAGSAMPIQISVASAATVVPPATVTALPGNAVLVRLPLLTAQTGVQVRAALRGLDTSGGIVVDLRGNGGGDIEAAEQVLATLTTAHSGETFGYALEAGGKTETLAPRGDRAATARRIVVLTDRGVAQEAEALAAALAETGGATLVGGRTFGDTTMTGFYALPDGSGFTLTTGKMLGPHHRDWQVSQGLVPQVSLPAGATDAQVIARALDTLHHGTQTAKTPARAR